MLSQRAQTSTAAAELVQARRVPAAAARVELGLEGSTVPAASAQSASLLQRKTRAPATTLRGRRASGDDTATEGQASTRRIRPGRGYHRCMSSIAASPPAARSRAAAAPGASAGASRARGPGSGSSSSASRGPAARRSRRRRGIGGPRFRRPLRPLRAATDQDRPELVRLRRRQLAPRGHPGRAEPAGRPARPDLAVAREGDGRDRGPAVLLPRRRRRRGHRPGALARRQGGPRRRGRLDDHAAARPQPLHLERAHGRAEGHRGVPRGEARGARSKERILAQYLNSVFYGNLAYGAEAAARTYFSRPGRGADPPAGGAARRAQPGAVGLRPVRRPRPRGRAAEPGARGNARGGHDHPAPVPVARRTSARALSPGRLYAQIREPYFFGYVRDELVHAVRRRDRPLGRPAGLHDDRAALAAARPAGDPLDADAPDDPAAAVISINPWNGAIRAMTAIVPGRANNQFNLLSQARRQPGSTFKTFVLAAAVERGLDPELDVLRLGALRVQARRRRQLRRRQLVVRQDLRLELQRLDVGRARDAPLGQLRLRAADPRRRAAAGRVARPAPRRADAARRPRPVRARDGARLGRRVAARHGLRVRDARGRRHLHGADRDPARSSSAASPTTAGRPSRRRTRVLSDGVAAVVTAILEDNVRYGTGTRAALTRPAAGKTGTTDEHADAWFVGYTPGLATAVWMGYTRGEVPMTNVHGISVSGGSSRPRSGGASWSRRSPTAPSATSPSPRQPGDVHDLGARADVAQLRPVLHAADAAGARGGGGREPGETRTLPRPGREADGGRRASSGER